MMTQAIPTPTRLYFIRHGEVEERYQKVFAGRLDIDLSANGLRQAERLAASLRPIHFDAIYVSPMKRAQRTVAPLIATNGHSPVTLEDLREVDFGAWTGHTWDDVRSHFGKSAFDWLHELDTQSIPQAEAGADLRHRVARCVDLMRSRHVGQNVAVVCHGGVVRAALAYLLDLPLPKMAHFEIDYASVSIVELGRRPGRTELILLNHTPWQSTA